MEHTYIQKCIPTNKHSDIWTNIWNYKHTFHTNLIQYFLLWNELDQTQPYIECAILFSIGLMISMKKPRTSSTILPLYKSSWVVSNKNFYCKPKLPRQNCFSMHKFDASVWCWKCYQQWFLIYYFCTLLLLIIAILRMMICKFPL